MQKLPAAPPVRTAHGQFIVTQGFISRLLKIQLDRAMVRAEDFVMDFSSGDAVFHGIGDEEVVDTPSSIALTRLEAV